MLPKDMRIVEALPTPQEFNHLREAVGWGTIDEDLVRKGLANSLYALCIRSSGSLIGFVRLVGDGALKVYIEELIIDPEYQGRGLGSHLMNLVMKHVDETYRHGCSIGLFANTGLAGFYARFGFIARDEARPGMQVRL